MHTLVAKYSLLIWKDVAQELCNMLQHQILHFTVNIFSSAVKQGNPLTILCIKIGSTKDALQQQIVNKSVYLPEKYFVLLPACWSPP